MAERNVIQAEQARDELRSVVGLSVADEMEKLSRLKISRVDQRCRICTTARLRLCSDATQALHPADILAVQRAQALRRGSGRELQRSGGLVDAGPNKTNMNS